MKSIKKILKNKRGEGRLDTGVKIIIAVVIGTLILGGLCFLFSNVIMAKMNRGVQEMMHYKENASFIRSDAFTGKLTSLQYSYDSTTWYNASVPELSDDAVLKTCLSTAEKGFYLAIVNDNDTIYIIMTEDNGIHWSVAHNIGELNSGGNRVNYSLSPQKNGTYEMTVRIYDGGTATSGWGRVYQSDDGRKWCVKTLGIRFF